MTRIPGSLLNNQDSIKSKVKFFSWLCCGRDDDTMNRVPGKITPLKSNERPLKRKDFSIGNTSEPTIDFQGAYFSFRGSNEWNVFL